MLRYFYLVLMFGLGVVSFAQSKPMVNISNGNEEANKAKEKGKKYVNNKVALISDYLIFNKQGDSSFVDTTLSVKKLYKFNYLQDDNFNLISFANIGQTYNTLSFDSAESYGIPLFGARARHFNYLENKDISYYEVPTPWTRLTYKTVFQQGQLLDAFFTVNLSKQFNFSIAYKGLRSIGNYRHALTSTGNLRLTSNYKSKNGRYRANGHIVWQDLLNQENGGLQDKDIINFTSGNEEFIDRAVFDPNFENAESILVGKRFFLDQTYQLITPNDSIPKNSLSIAHTIAFEDKYFEYTQTTPSTTFFGDAFTGLINDRATLENFQTGLKASYFNNILGSLQFGIDYTDVNYGYDTVVLLMGQSIPNRIKSNFLGINAGYSKTYNGFNITGNAGINLSDDFAGNFLKGEVSYKLNKDIRLKGSLSINSRRPNYNYLLYQSDYINYNWYNFDQFENVNTQQIAFNLESSKYAHIDFDISNIDNYTYFNLEGVNDLNRIIKPRQYQNTLQYLRFKIRKDIRVGKFGLDNAIMYQNVIGDEDVLNVPELITRNTLYFKDKFFKNAMIFQTGVVFNYFTKYNMNGYDPLLAEFYTQNQTELGGFPRMDFFINAKIRQTRIFLIAEHFNSSLTGYDYFSAPNQPYRDFTIRFGLVWDFFL
ncbi:putative porin [Winogradskyella aurantia]|uniref:Porin n=1 Tax=Winogradskyella aurantia TaxID=1915063 RepID=A0A265UPD9_9FLAO|nr:putative porin [Winogradskyella aurantia]OZV67109.1 hypothetical protein CA834_12345 [Winogradskyella aurantia]